MSADAGRRRLLSRVSIQSKLLLMLLLTSVLSAAIVGAIGYQSGRNSLRAAVFDRLTEIRESQTRQIETQFADLKNSLVIYTRGSTAINAMDAFSKGFDRTQQCHDHAATAAADRRLLQQAVRCRSVQKRPICNST